ncbi:thioredoxin [Mediterraneibacter glycyrrhizinilyticus]|uniref:thioredoxin n=1 Tax=Mediterraneibacter glycyrrhizinilyticus TaxID=342942 RepID=UPI0025AAFED4|nr:thioredoxin [Mediterraneibacter glycyrrhizinilyticus]MCF2568931.1 thioredoxin [Mediterraneibacter glycyrrhizinilyticus]MDN0042943.1 thioredoxin [Mediterraneibacter glycyrrhizinilyticus]MDN0061030.1 thioredoxin [Mediterraneibacter glycyrrhizinilyticus]
MAVVKLTTDNFDQEVLQAGQTVLVDFYADWCGPCKMMGPVVEELAGEESNVKVCKINIDEEMAVAQKYGVMSIPTFISFKNGEVAGKQVGAVPKSKLQELIR